MKRHFGARPAESFTRSKYWIAANLKREGAVLGLERTLTSIANDRCLRDRTFFRHDLTHFELGRREIHAASWQFLANSVRQRAITHFFGCWRPHRTSWS